MSINLFQHWLLAAHLCSKYFSASFAPSGYYISAAFCGHSLAKTMNFRALTLFRLECHFHYRYTSSNFSGLLCKVLLLPRNLNTAIFCGYFHAMLRQLLLVCLWAHGVVAFLPGAKISRKKLALFKFRRNMPNCN